jgi:hypothetical protein
MDGEDWSRPIVAVPGKKIGDPKATHFRLVSGFPLQDEDVSRTFPNHPLNKSVRDSRIHMIDNLQEHLGLPDIRAFAVIY